MYALEVSKIVKSFGAVKALSGIGFEVMPGEIYGMIGPDGAGKSTLFRILISLLVQDSGTARVLGLDNVKDYKKLRPRLGYMPGRFSLYEDLTVEENMQFYASIFKTTITENYYLVKDIYSQIEPFRDRKAGKLSGGMKQKLALSCALIHKPELLVLDEPTTGVDAVSRGEFWEMLSRLQKEGITILVSTPYMDEASLCDRIALIQKGHILRADTPGAICNSYSKPLYSVSADMKFSLSEVLKNYPGSASVYPFGDSFHYTDLAGTADIDKLSAFLKASGIGNFRISEIRPGIEDVFIDLLGDIDHE